MGHPAFVLCTSQVILGRSGVRDHGIHGEVVLAGGQSEGVGKGHQQDDDQGAQHGLGQNEVNVVPL